MPHHAAFATVAAVGSCALAGCAPMFLGPPPSFDATGTHAAGAAVAMTYSPGGLPDAAGDDWLSRQGNGAVDRVRTRAHTARTMRCPMFLVTLVSMAAFAGDTDEMFPGETQILEQIEAQDLAEQAAPPPDDGAIVVTPLDECAPLESLRDQASSGFDVPGAFAIDPAAFESIEDGAFPVPEVSPPTPAEDEPAP